MEKTKQNTCDMSNEDEMIVANILLDLEKLVIVKKLLSWSLTSWSTKKRRSNRGNYTTDCSSVSVQQGSSKVDGYNKIIIKSEEGVATSPATPLSFSPTSESDDKSKHSSPKFISKRKTREELMDMINQLSQCRESLRGEVENVRNYYNYQKAYNLKLKTMKDQVTRMLNIQGPGINIGQLYNNPGMELKHPQPFVMDQIAIGSETFHRFQYPLGHLQQARTLFSSKNGLGPGNQTVGLGPLGLPDLNVSVDETSIMDCPSPFDLDRINAQKKAQYAAARRRRMIKRTGIKSAYGLIRPPRRR